MGQHENQKVQNSKYGGELYNDEAQLKVYFTYLSTQMSIYTIMIKDKTKEDRNNININNTDKNPNNNTTWSELNFELADVIHEWGRNVSVNTNATIL